MLRECPPDISTSEISSHGHREHLHGAFVFALTSHRTRPPFLSPKVTPSVSSLRRSDVAYEPRKVFPKRVGSSRVLTEPAQHFEVQNFVPRIQKSSSGGDRFCPGVPPDPFSVFESYWNSFGLSLRRSDVEYDPRRVGSLDVVTGPSRHFGVRNLGPCTQSVFRGCSPLS